MKTANVWENLDNIWGLAGVVLVVFAGLLKSLSGKNIDNPAVERLMYRGVNFLFILGLVSIVLGFIVTQPKNANTTKITQTISNSSGTAINAAESVNGIQSPPSATDRTRQERPTSVNQKIEENSGIAINAGGNFSTNNQKTNP